MNIDSLKFYNSDEVEQLRIKRLHNELKLWQAVTDGKEGALEELHAHQKEDRKLKKELSKIGFRWEK